MSNENGDGVSIIKDLGTIKYGLTSRHCYLCLGKCGKEYVIKKSNIDKRGLPLKCRECISNNYIGRVGARIFCYIKNKAAKRGIKFEITKKYVDDLYQKQR